MNLNHLSHSTRRFLMERLERLHTALENLGQRLREGIAQLVGSHIGEAVQDALATALLHRPLSYFARPDRDPRRYPGDDLHREREDWPHADERHAGFWEEREPEPPPPPRPSRWRSVVAGSVHLATLWCRYRPPRRSLLRFLGLGAVAALVTLAAGSLVGGIVATVGTAVLLTRTADTAAKAAQSAAELPAN
jgi:hypothetical protein